MIEGKKILLTGLTGRIGNAIAVDLVPRNEVWGLARYTRAGSKEAAESIGVKAVVGDYARGSLDQVPTDFDYVLHVAASISPSSAEAAMADNSDGAARLMMHCRSARVFLHVSTTGVYRQHEDPWHVYPEESDLGGFYGGQYAPAKLAGEGAVRAAAIILGLPTVICRQNVQYGGPTAAGGLIDRFLDMLVETGNVPIPAGGSSVCAPIHEDDICGFVGPCLGIASVPASIINWSGDEGADWIDIFEHAGKLLGKVPNWVPMPELQLPNCVPDTSKRKSIAGPCTVHWKDGIRRSLELRHPGIALSEIA
jgi:UDP-glucuronate 4-epimerase